MTQQTYAAFLRGINVGGHRKVPMAELRQMMEQEGFTDVKTLLNSGNLIFTGSEQSTAELEHALTAKLAERLGFQVPVMLRIASEIHGIIDRQTFSKVETHKDIRLYLSFLREKPAQPPSLPWRSNDGSFEILEITNRTVYSVLDVSQRKTPEAMGILEKMFSKDITTRNWNTLQKIAAKL